MSSIPLTISTRAKLDQLFPQEQRSEAVDLLEVKCGGGLPLIEAQGAEGIERIRCAALKISDGSLEKLHEAVQLANIDWRDVLVAAGFADSTLAHLSWLKGTNHA
jgi:hypothetical protein